MRAFAVLVALVATPFVVGVSQGLGHDAAHCAMRAGHHWAGSIFSLSAPGGGEGFMAGLPIMRIT